MLFGIYRPKLIGAPYGHIPVVQTWLRLHVFLRVSMCVSKLFDQTNSLGRSSFYWRWHKFWNFYAVTPVCQ